MAATFLFSLAFSACGIQTIIYYDPPDVEASSNLLTIEHDSSNDSADYFQGYEVYYRVFDDEDKAQSIGSAIYSASNSTSISPDYLLSQLEAGSGSYSGYPFHRMTDGTETRPLLPVSSGTEYGIYIKEETDWTYYIGSGSSELTLKRGVTDGSGYRSFAESEAGETWLSGDTDYSGSDVSGDTDLYLVAFAVAYGFDPDNVETVYSMPAVFYTSPSSGTQYYIEFTGH